MERGYIFEEFTTVTEDGYVLTLFRIPGKLTETQPIKGKEPILLQHGIIDNGGTWIFGDA